MRRLYAILVTACCAAAALAVAAPGAGATVGARARSSAAPGALIKKVAIAAPAGAEAWKITYHSRTVDGRDATVSGIVVAPKGTAPKNGRPVLSWAHGTTGIADQCAPSAKEHATESIPYLAELVQAGYVVTATDYQGLGTAGVHPFLVGQSEGRNVLDAALAAGDIPATHASKRVLIAGLSQGGGAALFAGELAPTYAPSLDVLGVVAAAPAADVERILPLAGAVQGGAGYVALASYGFDAAYPDAKVLDILTPDARERAKVALTGCSGDVQAAFNGYQGSLFARDPLADPALAKLLHENSAGNQRTKAPILVVQGSADATIPKIATDAFVAKACATGDTLDYRTYDGATHGSVITAAQADVLAWLAARADGTAPTSTCR